MKSAALRRIPVLMYHQITVPVNGDRHSELYSIPPRVFAQQMWYLRLARYNPVTMTQIAAFYNGEGTLPNRPVAITFDDGYENVYTHAFPILRRYGFTATVYLVGELIGKTNRWDEREGITSARLMNVPQITEMDRSGVQFGAHTMNHPHLSNIPIDEAVHEIAYGKGYLEALLGKPVETFCYPYGPTSYNKRIRRIVIESGYRAACGCDPGCNTPDDDPYYLRRLFPKSFTDLRRFASLMRKMPRDFHAPEDYWK